MTTARERKTMEYTAILEEISIGATMPRGGGGFLCAAQSKSYENHKPWTLEEMRIPNEESWALREYNMTAITLSRPVPDEAELEKDGWHELNTLRRYIARGRLQTVFGISDTHFRTSMTGSFFSISSYVRIDYDDPKDS